MLVEEPHNDRIGGARLRQIDVVEEGMSEAFPNMKVSLHSAADQD